MGIYKSFTDTVHGERDRAVSFLGIFVSNILYSALAVMAKLAAAKVQYTIDSIPIPYGLS